MQKYTNKTVILGLLVVIGIPQVVSAAWWNPFTWFPKPDSKTEVLELRIKELEAKINSTPTTTVSVATSTPKKAVVKTPSVISNSAPEEDIEIKLQQDMLRAVQKAEEQAKIDALKAATDRQAQIDAINAQRAKEKADEEARATQIKIEVETQRTQEKLDALDAVNLKIANLNAKYAEDMKTCGKSGGSTAGAASCKQAMTNRYTDDYNALMAEWQVIYYSN